MDTGKPPSEQTLLALPFDPIDEEKAEQLCQPTRCDMGVDLNSFIWDPSFLAKKVTLAKLSLGYYPKKKGI